MKAKFLLGLEYRCYIDRNNLQLPSVGHRHKNAIIEINNAEVFTELFELSCIGHRKEHVIYLEVIDRSERINQ